MQYTNGTYIQRMKDVVEARVTSGAHPLLLRGNWKKARHQR